MSRSSWSKAVKAMKWNLVKCSLAAVILGFPAAGFAWACTPQPQILLMPRVGPPGSVITVTGSAFEPDSSVQIRWNAQGGPKLGDVRADSGGGFVLSAGIPEDAKGVSMVLALAGEAETARMPFQVTGGDSSAPFQTRSVRPARTQQVRTGSNLWDGFDATAPGPRAALPGGSARGTLLRNRAEVGAADPVALAFGALLTAFGLTALVLGLTLRSWGNRPIRR